MTSPPSLASLIADLLDRLATGHLDHGYSQTITRGSASGTVAVRAPAGDLTNPLLVVTLEIMRSPSERREELYQRLLELNGSLLGRAAFKVRSDGVVCLLAGRPIADLDAGELIDLIVWTADQADEFDDPLLDEFGPELGP